MTLGITGLFSETDTLSLELALHGNTRLWVHSTEIPDCEYTPRKHQTVSPLHWNTSSNFLIVAKFLSRQGPRELCVLQENNKYVFMESMHTIV